MIAIPVYHFKAAVAATAVIGFVQFVTGNLGRAESASYDVVPSSAFDQGLVGLAGAFLIARAFASGCAALTGVEAISNGVPAFKKPKSRNAATTLRRDHGLRPRRHRRRRGPLRQTGRRNFRPGGCHKPPTCRSLAT